jgi:hypothetical protein
MNTKERMNSCLFHKANFDLMRSLTLNIISQLSRNSRNFYPAMQSAVLGMQFAECRHGVSDICGAGNQESPCTLPPVPQRFYKSDLIRSTNILPSM